MMDEAKDQVSLINSASPGTALLCGPDDLEHNELGSKKVKRKPVISPVILTMFCCVLMALSTPIMASDQLGAGKGPTDAVVLIIRHGEKPDKGERLSKAGERRAKAYVGYFSNFTVGSKPLKVDYLFATADSKASHRARLTLEPFSKAVGLKINDRFNDTQVQDLAVAVQAKPPGKQFLICWHHGEIPELVSALGADPNALFRDGKWPDDVYDWLIQLRYDATGHLIEAKRINEGLMPGDRLK